MVRYKKDLAGQLGNLVARCTAPALIPKGTVPTYNKDAMTNEDRALHDQLLRLPGIVTCLHALSFQQVIHRSFRFLRTIWPTI